MLYLTLRKKNNVDNSFVLLLYNSKKRIVRKCGVLFYEKKLGKFVFHIDFFLVYKLFNYNFVFTCSFFEIFSRFTNSVRF
jgi:hypothetical protein